MSEPPGASHSRSNGWDRFDTPREPREGRWRVWWMGLILGALWLRVAAAAAVQWYAQSRGTLCVFGDTSVYWALAQSIHLGLPYEVSQWGVAHQALRPPAYPLFLAACQSLFGAHLLPVRLVQAALGTLCVLLVERLARRLPPDPIHNPRFAKTKTNTNTHTFAIPIPMLAALLLAFEPYSAALSALVLSESLFVPLMLAALLGVACLWTGPGQMPPRSPTMLAAATGATIAAALATRPSWAVFVPFLLVSWWLHAGRSATRPIAIVILAACAVLAPWWIRNAQVTGRFVPFALWMGASLYDGLNPRATGASDMEFLNEPAFWPLTEIDQDQTLTRASWAFAREQPLQALQLAVVKAARFWSPWPNAETFQRPLLNAASAMVALPLYGLMALGLWHRRRDLRAWVLLAGPLLYFGTLHMIFVSSIRYRIPGMAPALVLAAIGLARLAQDVGNRRSGRQRGE